ncbi:MAG: glutamate racemase [Clostridia bacterium]|nr:glutamate racemase [Clostridia bacterium]
MDNRPIGIFDSGLGGLTCVKKVMELLPGEDIIYFGDTGRVPYGSRSAETIVKYVRQNIRFLKTFDIKFIIIACGTASSAALPLIRDEFDIDIAGVLEPTCKKAAEVTECGKIGVIGTAGTIKSGKYLQTLKELKPELEIYSKACPMFVPLVENGYLDSEATRIIAEEYLLPLKEKGIDTLILGCTHYPLLKPLIQDIMGNGVNLIDAGGETAFFAQKYLTEKELLSDRTQGTARYYVSDVADGFANLAGMFLEKEIDGKVSTIDIENY